MTKEDIIHMARLYGTPVQEKNQDVKYLFTVEDLGLLISTVQILERGACAKVCDDASVPLPGELQSDAQWSALCLAKAIRARGETTLRWQT